jgi:serine/threonine protein phosphatase PrpC
LLRIKLRQFKMIRCLQCGFENPNDHKFCQRCGVAISGTPDPSETQTPEDTIDTVTTDVDAPQRVGLATLHSSDEETVDEKTVDEELAHVPSVEQTATEGSKGEETIPSPEVYDDEVSPAPSPHPKWLAILTLLDSPILLENANIPSPDSSPADSLPADSSPAEDSLAVVDKLQAKALELQERGYVDSQQRYRVGNCVLKTPRLFQGEGIPYLELVVVDERPDEPPYLDQSPDQTQGDSPVEGDRPDVASLNVIDAEQASQAVPSQGSEQTTEISGRREDRLEPYHEDELSSVSQITPDDEGCDPVLESNILSTTQIYLMVQDQFYPSLPQVYDAWQSDDTSVVVVENRNELLSLHHALHDQETTPLQALHWLHEMTELWAVLQPHGYHHSLLDLSNLHIDEDHILCITSLYRPIGESKCSLPDLGEFWKRLLSDSHLQTNSHLSTLCEDLAQHTIASIDDLRLRLEDIACFFHDKEAVDSASAMQHDEASTIGIDSAKTVSGVAANASLDSTSDDFYGQDTVDEELELYPEGDEAPTVVLPMRLFNLADAGLTDIGRQRDHNEDYFSIQSETQKQDTPAGRVFAAKGLYVLCDGMGGHAAGEVASALAVSTLEDYFENTWTDRFPSKDDIRAAICKANESIYDLNQENACYGSGRMGTTLVMMLVEDIKVAIAHVGDSRVYRFSRRTGLEQITTDHEVGQREIQRGVEPAIAYARPDAYQLTQALGPRDSSFINPDIQTFEVNEDTLFLMCSDGLSDNHLLEQHCESHVEPMLSSQSNLEQMLYALIDLANQRNGHDNITAIAIRMKVRPKIQSIQ